MKTKVVVTGQGVVSPLGNDTATYWNALCEGRSGISAVDRFDMTGYPSRIAGLVRDCIPANMSKKELRRQDRYSLYALHAADQAWEQSGLDIDREDPLRVGVVLGTGVGGIETIELSAKRLYEKGPRRVSPLFVPMGLANMASANVAMRLGLMGPNKAIVSACATGTHCIGDAADLIRAGRADVMLAGGAEATLTPVALAGFGAMRALSTRNDEPTRASRPFDKDRDGFVMAEGAGLVVLESESHAKARGAQILCELAGYGETCDAYHITAPRPDGIASIAAMETALRDAQCPPCDVEYINAHGTSTVYNDVAEVFALRKVFGEAMPPVSSTKSMTGHLMAAAGAIEAVACVQAIRTGTMPPSINYETPDPACDLNLVANEAREANVAIAMSNSLGFGGHNASIVFKSYAD